jgi:hypothetical protein
MKFWSVFGALVTNAFGVALCGLMQIAAKMLMLALHTQKNSDDLLATMRAPLVAEERIVSPRQRNLH